MTTRTKGFCLAGAIVAATIATAAASYSLWLRPKPKAPDAAQAAGPDVLQYMASNTFAKLPTEQKQAYFNDIQQRTDRMELMRMSQTLGKEQQDALRKNVGPLIQQMVRDRVEGYFNTPPEQRNAYLDKIIDEGRGRMLTPPDATKGEGSAVKDGGKNAKDHPRLTPEQLRNMLADTKPEERAKFVTFAMALGKRMQERNAQ